MFFIGNGKLYFQEKQLRSLLETEIRKHILEHDVTEFFVGNYGAYDFLVRSILERIKTEFPQIIKNCLITQK